MSVELAKARTSPSDPDAVEVLIKEARRRGRQRLVIGVSACVAAAGLVITLVAAIGSRTPVITSRSPGSSMPTGALATVDRMGRGSSIFVVDMLSVAHGFAIAGRPGQGHSAYLVATSTGGKAWIVRGRLPFSLRNDGFSVPSLLFLNGRVGYTQSGIVGSTAADRGVFVTTDGGVTWRPLSLSGITPTAAGDNLTAGSVNESYQVAGGVVSLVTLRCTDAELSQGGSVCLSVLEQFRVGAVQPFADWTIPAIGDRLPGGRAPSDRLLAAVSARIVIVAQGDLEGWSPVLISRTGGRTWTTWPTPCGSLHVGGLNLQLPIQELHTFRPNWWVLDCWQDAGMSQGSLVVSATRDGGRTWHVLSEGSEGSNAGGIPVVGNIGDADQTIWSSNDGRVLWAWESIRGWFSESTDGGRQWTQLGAFGPGIGGPPTVDLSPVGPQGAFLIALGRAFETANGTKWRHVRLLPAS